MNGEERRKEILKFIGQSPKPVSGTELAKQFDVSRQVIVQDVALLRAQNQDILSTHRGYVLKEIHKIMHCVFLLECVTFVLSTW